MTLEEAIRIVCDAATLWDSDSEEMLKASQMVFALQNPAPVVVVLEGGRVRNSMTNANVVVHVIDYEVDGIPMEDLTEVPQSDGSMALAEVYDASVEPLDEPWTRFVEWWMEQ